MTMITPFIWSLFTEANFDTEFGVGFYNRFRATCEWKPKKISFFFLIWHALEYGSTIRDVTEIIFVID